ncbi:RNA polymerase factor sigma-54 [Kangiella sp. HZ709]|uniref:RNA polymerase factor sigma-54 n=1 Tax=Kangiella sp. HZ709 TaxID=2666328 RepID=UPI0012AF86D8|nr:RNA polymerase factor sigma-54 [Kangiella sp. HZ709]MRX27472.1 RNA polymerase factor sigma-54 [Kangiella sp. HZ709]
MNQALELQLKQQIKLNPQLQQSIKLLQLSQLELAQEIQYQLDNNPLLICEDSQNNPETDEFNSKQLTANNLISASNLTNTNSHTQENYWEAIPDQVDFKESLESQLQLHHLSRKDLEIGYYIIENLNESGFLTLSEREIANQIRRDTQLETDEDEVLAIKHLIQTFEPSGCACLDLQEFLSFQITHNRNLAISQQRMSQLKILFNHHFQLLVAHQYEKIENKLGISKDKLKTLLSIVQTLRQRPNDYRADDSVDYIKPDINFSQSNHQWQAKVNTRELPRLQINPDYLELAKQTVKTDEKKYIKDKAQLAQQFLNSLAARKSTLQRIADYLIVHQKDFFEKGDIALKPLNLITIATALDLHESTISRATSNKYCQTPSGVIPLKSLFSNAINPEKGGEWSQTAVKHQVQEIIKSEPSQKPLSDSSIVSLLAELGITVARRTVAKYRDALNIPSATKRKQLSTIL